MTHVRNARGPSLRRSAEGEPTGLELGRKQGEAYRRTVAHMSRDIAQQGESRRAGDYTVGYAIEKAEGMYRMEGGRLHWKDPDPEENVHVEIVVMDAGDNRFIPGLEVYVTVLTAEGREVGTHRHPFLWHPYLFHYGRNWRLPEDGSYRLRIRIEPADFMRHDKVNGKRYATPVEVEFDGVEVATGREQEQKKRA